MTTVKRQKLFCGACGSELAPDDVKRLPSAASAFVWQQESPGCSFWRCRKCVEGEAFPPGFENDEWYRALDDGGRDFSLSSRLMRVSR